MKKIFYLLTFTVFFLALMISCTDDKTTGIELDRDSVLLHFEKSVTLTANLLPLGATGKIKWNIDNSNVATLEYESDRGVLSRCVVTAKAVGTATVTATTKDGKHSATCSIRVINIEPELIFVEGGTFTMGCTDDECDDTEKELPAHEVTLSSFYIAKYTVTQEVWRAVMGENPSYFKGDLLPVETVSWYDAQDFIGKLNTITGNKYRLPTEAEWEYAARGGNQSKGFKYSGSNDIDVVAWYKENNNGTTHPVGTKAPNELGIYDMSGNISEWCSDWYGTYTAESQINPVGPSTGTFKIRRGGNWQNPNLITFRISSRGGTTIHSRFNSFGFRLVLL
ncbi:MAG: formylglycine-generating enzyme family protein [Lentimicrobiaceae bacterium]|nr:formylglycine-generating enzyme family protein [Lentimicrobiaceae bacterium]